MFAPLFDLGVVEVEEFVEFVEHFEFVEFVEGTNLMQRNWLLVVYCLVVRVMH